MNISFQTIRSSSVVQSLNTFLARHHKVQILVSLVAGTALAPLAIYCIRKLVGRKVTKETKKSTPPQSSPPTINGFPAVKLKDITTSRSENLKEIIPDKASGFSFTYEKQVSPTGEAGSPVDSSFAVLETIKTMRKDSLLLASSFVNNYPQTNTQGQISCDAFYGQTFLHYKYSIVADGCGLGIRSREAAQRAVGAVANHLNNVLTHCSFQTAEEIASTPLRK